MDEWPNLCNLCGCKGPSHCSKCKKTFYCSRKHQILDWQKGHKQICPELQVRLSEISNLSILISIALKMHLSLH